MQKITLRFPSLEGLAAFTKECKGGFFANANTLTVTARLTDEEIRHAVSTYQAISTGTGEQVARTYAH